MKVNFDINEALGELAKGLGVAAEKVYPILYKQAMIEGSYLLISLICIVGSWLFIYKVCKGSIKGAKKDYEDNKKIWEDSLVDHIVSERLFQGVTGCLFCMFIVIYAIATFFTAPELIKNMMTAFFNTDYYIIDKVIKEFIK